MSKIAGVSRSHRIRTAILDALLALGFGWLALHDVRTSAIGLAPAAVGPAFAVLAGLALMVRRRFPIPVLAITALAEIAAGASAPMVLGVYTVANRFGNRAVTWWCGAGALVVAVVPWGPPPDSTALLRAPVVAVLLAFPFLLGLWVNQRRELVTGLRERAEQAERERDLRAAAAVEAERIRIARELHDIVAHRISQITVQAGALEVSTDGRPAEIAATIRATGVRALDEMREMLGVLRSDTGSVADPDGPSADRAPVRPAPDLAAVTELLDAAVAAGHRVRLRVPDPLPEVPGPVGRAVHRLVQEALTNAAKHAAGAEVRVTIGWRAGVLDVDVRNGPGRVGALAAHGSGFGLVGMRERVELAGGTLRCTAMPSGGFVVYARFPVSQVGER